MRTFLSALALALFFEGIIFVFFPRLMRRTMLEAADLSDNGIRSMGGTALAFAIIICFIVRLLY